MTTQANNVAIESSQINSSGVLLTTGGGTGLSTVGTNGQVLTSNGTTLSWVTPTTTSPGGSAGYVQYNTGSAFGGSANFYWDNTNSRLGIGTSSPSYELHVYNGGGNAQIGLNYGTATTGLIEGFSAGLNLVANGASTYMTFATGGTNASERMRISSAGNVGIGTNNPTYTLDVTGTTRLSLGNNSIDFANSSGTPYWRFYPSFNDGYFYISRASGNPSISSAADLFKFAPAGSLQLLASSQPILNAGGRPMLNQTGGVLQTLSFTYRSVFSSTGTGYVATPITISITPSSTSSQILVFGHGNFGIGGSGVGKFAIYRNSSILTNANGNNSGYGSAVSVHSWSDYNNSDDIIPGSFHYLDSPASTSAQTYTLYYEPGQGPGTWYVNRPSSLDTGSDNGAIGVSTITVMEIAA